MQACFGLVFAAHTFAQGGPPMITDCPGTPGRHVTEINVSYTTQRKGSSFADTTPSVIVGYGITDAFQAFVVSSWSTTNQALNGNAQGFGDTDLGLKYRFIDKGDGKLQVSTAPQFFFNTSHRSVDTGLVSRDSSLYMPLQACCSWGPIDLDMEVAYHVHRDANNQVHSGFCIGHQFPGNVELDAEVNGIYDLRDHTWTRFVNVGTRLRLSKGVGLLGSVGQQLGHFDGSKPWIAFVGLQFDY